MNINLPVSLGEAIDKYTILIIKQSEIKDVDKLTYIQTEIDVIYPQIKNMINKYMYHYNCLLHINKEIWRLSEQVRDPNLNTDYKNTIFLETFYKNDARYRIKNKFNKLGQSVLQEQKSYPNNTVYINAHDTQYIEKNNYIRYLSLCYDTVVLVSTATSIKNMFMDDPHIIVTDDKINNIVYNTLDILNEPIPHLLNTVNFSKTSNYLCGGKLGDFIHSLYVIMCHYTNTGIKGNIYITNNTTYGGDSFTFNIEQTYKELYDIVITQDYINTFEIYNQQPIDVNLNNFRNYQHLWSQSWLQILSQTFKTPLLEQPWIKFNIIDEQYKDTILIHQSTIRRLPRFLPILEKIIKNNKCIFVTCNINEYNTFALKYLINVHVKTNIYDMYIAINSCKFFVGNQSAPLAIAYSLFKPLLCEHNDGKFYTNVKHYEHAYWFTSTQENINYKLLNI